MKAVAEKRELITFPQTSQLSGCSFSCCVVLIWTVIFEKYDFEFKSLFDRLIFKFSELFLHIYIFHI